MGTPFIQLVKPGADGLRKYIRDKPPSEQPASVPKEFLDAMEVRIAVFGDEQGVPLENEFDDDDVRSCHWIVYASINKIIQHEQRDEAGHVIQRQRSETFSQPIGTVRLVPFPHYPHPRHLGIYVAKDGDLVLTGIKEHPESDEVLPVPEESGDRRPSQPRIGDLDRATTYHDGREVYVKLGRLAVIKDFRSRMIGRLLVNTALGWLANNGSYFDPSVTKLGFEKLGIDNIEEAGEVPRFKGLVCAHAQASAVGMWEKLGFKVDPGMGRWWEEGIEHVGMFQRLQLKPEETEI